MSLPNRDSDESQKEKKVFSKKDFVKKDVERDVQISFFDAQGVVIDLGSGFIKAGISGDSTPKCILPSTIDKHVEYSQRVIQRGIISDWNQLEQVIRHIFDEELKFNPKEHPTILTEAALTPKEHRAKLTEMMFEKFNVMCFYLAVKPVLSLYSTGKTSGFVVNSGYGLTSFVPIYEGYALPEQTMNFPFGGEDLSNHMVKLLGQVQGLDMSSVQKREIVRDMKEKECFVSDDYEKMSQHQNPTTSSFELPDGNKVNLGVERFKTAEILFRPSLFECDALPSGLPKLMMESIRKCDEDCRKSFLSSILLSGGNTLFPGISKRFSDEITKTMLLKKGETFQMNDVDFESRRFFSFKGASILSSLRTYGNQWISKVKFLYFLKIFQLTTEISKQTIYKSGNMMNLDLKLFTENVFRSISLLCYVFSA